MDEITKDKQTGWTPGPHYLTTVPTSIGHCHQIMPMKACLYVDNRDMRELHDSKTATAKANAHLFAAALDLYEALDTLTDQMEFYGLNECPEHKSEYQKAMATLAKARGGESS